MATKIVNPYASSNGTGSLISPLNAWPSSFSAGDEVLQIADTVWSGYNSDSRYGILVNNSGTSAAPIVCGVCEPQTGVRITDGSKRAKVTGPREMGVRTGTVNYVTLDGFEVYDVTGTGSTKAIGVYSGGSAASPNSRIQILNCYIHDIANSGIGDDTAIQIFGNDCRIAYNIIHDIADDGIWCQGSRNIIEHNRIERVGQGPDITGDGIQCFGDATLGNSGMVIRYNYIDHSDKEEKQGIILQGHTSTSVGGQIYGNIVKHPMNPSAQIITIYIELLNVSVWGNYVEGGYYGILTGLTANGSGNNARIFGNVVKGARIGIDQGSSNTGAKIFNNTVIETLDYGIYCDNDTTVEIKNNIVYRCQKGIARENGSSEDYNCIYGTVDTANKYTSLGGGAITLGANSIEDDPLLDASYHPRSGSPCIGAGVYIPGARHYGGKRLASVPDIGAHRYFAARDIAEDRTVRLVGA